MSELSSDEIGDIHFHRDFGLGINPADLDFNNLKTLLKSNESEEYLLEIIKLAIDSGNLKQLTETQITKLLRLAVENGFAELIPIFIEQGGNVNVENIPPNSNKSGFYKKIRNILKQKMDSDEVDCTDEVSEDPLICVTLRDFGLKYNELSGRRLKCTMVLLQQNNLEVNASDRHGYTGFYYAIKFKIDELIRIFLEKGAIWDTNNNNLQIVKDIDPKVLEEYFDSCISVHETDSNSLKISLNYRNFITGVEIIELLAESAQHRHLILHPLIKYYVWLKRSTNKSLFLVTITATIMLVVMQLYMALINITNVEQKFSHTYFYLNIFATCFLFHLVVRYICYSIFSIILLKLRYFISFDHIFDLTMVILLVIIMYGRHILDDTMFRMLSTTVILMNGMEVMWLMEMFPFKVICIYAKILKKVTVNFIKFFCLYSILIFAFAASFYTLFDHRSTTPCGGFNLHNKSGLHFSTPWASIFKTMIMLSGEFEATEINFDCNLTTYFIFVAFIFVITIILMNLVNGLAVNDTQQIIADAEINLMVQNLIMIKRIQQKITYKPNKCNAKCLKLNDRQRMCFEEILILPQKGVTRIRTNKPNENRQNEWDFEIFELNYEFVEKLVTIFKARKIRNANDMMEREQKEWRRFVESKIQFIFDQLVGAETFDDPI